MPSSVVATVPARAALAGNPSDLYGGAVLAVPVFSFGARVEVLDAASTRISGDAEGHALVTAAVARSAATGAPFDLRWSTDIPRSVGLAGSSAIVVATLRAMAGRAGVGVDDLGLALRATAVEAEDLGIVAGLQDRAVQAFGRPVLVDVSGPAPQVTVVAPDRPLHIAVAWLADAAGDSGAYHGALRTRLASSVMPELAELARAAATAFGAGDAEALSEAMAASARVRAQVAPLSAAHDRLADAVAAATGARPNSAGSGGAVAAVLVDDDVPARVAAAVQAIGGSVVVETFE